MSKSIERRLAVQKKRKKKIRKFIAYFRFLSHFIEPGIEVEIEACSLPQARAKATEIKETREELWDTYLESVEVNQ